MQSRRKAQIWIYRDAEVLILQTLPERGGGYWQPVTGHVEEGESFEQGARREASEETGIPANSPLVALGGYQFDDRWGFHCAEEIFAMEAPARFEVKIEPTEHVAFLWRPLAEALERVKYPPPPIVSSRLQAIFK
jgi:8-oxo-dGTP pyrophosphatase MutT (NUDIX family)